MKTINVNGQILEILGLSATSKIAKNAIVYEVKKPKGKKIGKLFIRNNTPSSYLFGQENVYFDSYVVVA
jgi:hypothetical protein